MIRKMRSSERFATTGIRQRRIARRKSQRGKPKFALVKSYAARFPGKNINAVDAIVRDVSGFERVAVDNGVLRRFYARRSAEDILASRKIIFKKPVQGCVDYATVLCAVLRAKGIPAFFGRLFSNHSVTLFRMGNEWYRADPTPERVQEGFHLVQVNPKTEFKHYLAIGSSARDIGLRSIDDFDLRQTGKPLKNVLLEK